MFFEQSMSPQSHVAFVHMLDKHMINVNLQMNFDTELSRDVHEAFLVETEALTIQDEARPRPRPSELETETRPRRTNSEARPSRGTTAP